MQASRGCWHLASLCTEIRVVFDAPKLGEQSAALRRFLMRHGNMVRPEPNGPEPHSPALHKKEANP